MRKHNRLHTYNSQESSIMDAFENMMTEEVQTTLNEQKKASRLQLLNEGRGKAMRVPDNDFGNLINEFLNIVLERTIDDDFWDNGQYIFDMEVELTANSIKFTALTIDEMDDPDSEVSVEIELPFKSAKIKVKK